MRIWGIADLHLSFVRSKPMDVFGSHWEDHARRVEAAWRSRVSPEDVVGLPGDLSWALRLPDVEGELRWLGDLPGRKVLVRGNHDYWWSSITKVRRALPEGVEALQNDARVVDGVAFAGARGWVDPALDFRALDPDPASSGEPDGLRAIQGPEEDARIYRRELGRLEASLRQAPRERDLLVALLHFPPTSPAMEETPVTRLLERHGVDAVAFGHLHGAGWDRFRNPYGVREGIVYYLVSADFAGFAPVPLDAPGTAAAGPG